MSILAKAIDRLAATVPNGELMAATDPVALIDTVCAEIHTLRAREEVVERLCAAVEDLSLRFEGGDRLPYIHGLGKAVEALAAVRKGQP